MNQFFWRDVIRARQVGAEPPPEAIVLSLIESQASGGLQTISPKYVSPADNIDDWLTREPGTEYSASVGWSSWRDDLPELAADWYYELYTELEKQIRVHLTGVDPNTIRVLERVGIGLFREHAFTYASGVLSFVMPRHSGTFWAAAGQPGGTPGEIELAKGGDYLMYSPRYVQDGQYRIGLTGEPIELSRWPSTPNYQIMAVEEYQSSFSTRTGDTTERWGTLVQRCSFLLVLAPLQSIT